MSLENSILTRVADLQKVIISTSSFISHTDKKDLDIKFNESKWSKKEILGHLVDSAINNLQRFLEVQFKAQPYIIKKYQQDELVIANNYQKADITEIVNLWETLNQRISNLIYAANPSFFELKIILPDGVMQDVAYLFDDYVAHLEYHVKQIIN